MIILLNIEIVLKFQVLIVVNNYPWKYGMGLIQRLYQPYFATVIFCGSWYPAEFSDDTNFTPTLFPINYIHMNPAEIEKGYFAYHCVTLAKELGLHDVEGYFLVADDTVFNIWQRIDFSRVHHLTGVTCEDSPIWWSIADVGSLFFINPRGVCCFFKIFKICFQEWTQLKES